MRSFPREAVARLFLERQGLDRPFRRPATAQAMAAFVRDAGGLQLDSINVVERAHYLTLWSRFGAYDKSLVDRLAYEDRVLHEYWAHAACLVASEDLTGWGRAMADFRASHTGWAGWLKNNRRVARLVEEEIRRRGPLTAAAFERPAAQGKAGGWWDWKPAQHALQYLWLSGRLGVCSRRAFQKSYDLAERLRPAALPVSRAEFPLWHVRKSLRAMGAATDKDLAGYLTFPKLGAQRKRALSALLKSGEVVPVEVEGSTALWYALARDLKDLESPPEPRGTTLLCPFDSLMWHRARVKALFGFDYRIEVYTPGPKRVYGYYTLPILHEGRLVGRVDPKNHRAEKRLEIRAAHFDAKPDAALVAGTLSALRSLAGFVGAEELVLPRGPLR